MESTLRDCGSEQKTPWLIAYTIPSGIKPGTAKRQFFNEAKRIPLPEHLMPVIEDGNYDQTKECVFHVLALWCFDVMMEDLLNDFADAGFASRRQIRNRSWVYIQNTPEADQPTVTEVEVEFWISRNEWPSDITLLLERLSIKYGFRYDKVTYDRRSHHLDMGWGNEMRFNYSSSLEQLSMRLLFPLWR